MNKFFQLHDYSENMKARIINFSLKGKEDNWWEYVNNVRGIQEQQLTWMSSRDFSGRSIYLKDTIMSGKMNSIS